MNHLLRITLCFGVACLCFPSHAATDTLLDDKTPTLESIARNCMACHGERGISQGGMPSLVGIDKAQFIALLQDYRDGKGAPTIMNRLMQAFSDDDIRRLAQYFQDIHP